MELLEPLTEKFWSPSFWLPPNKTWEEVNRSADTDGLRIPKVEDIFFAWLLVPFFLLIKYVFEKYVGVNLAKWAGIKDQPRDKPPPVDVLEELFHSCSRQKKWSEHQLLPLVKQLGWSKEQIEEWLRARRRFDAPTEAHKFSESLWRFTFFFSMFSYGLYAHWSKEWFWDIQLCKKNFPQPVTEDLYWYFIISLTNYSSWIISHFWDVPRKDPKIMMFHHVSTWVLLAAQWIIGAHRFGLMVYLLHDVGDFMLELCKCLKYLGLKLCCQLMFVVFAFSWIITRNVILPLYLIPMAFLYSPYDMAGSFPFSCLVESCDISTFNFTSGHALLLVLVILSLLHVYWTCLICRIFYLVIFVVGR